MNRNEEQTGEHLWEVIEDLKRNGAAAATPPSDPEATEMSWLAGALMETLREEQAASNGQFRARQRLQEAITANPGHSPTTQSAPPRRPSKNLWNRNSALVGLLMLIILLSGFVLWRTYRSYNPVYPDAAPVNAAAPPTIQCEKR